MLRPFYDRVISIVFDVFRDQAPPTGEEPTNSPQSWRVWLPELAFYLLLAIAATWPLARHLETTIPKGQERVATVPLFNLWTIWWNADRAEALFGDYWHAPIFAPAENALALSEAQPVSIIVAPIVWASGSLSLAYNVYLLGVLAANGCSGSLLIRSLTGNRLAGLWCGAVLLLLPFVHWQLGVLQLTSISGIMLTLHFLIRFLALFRLRDALLTGVSIGFCYLSCNYHGYQLCLVLLLSSPVLLLKRCSIGRISLGAAVIIVVASVIVLPVVHIQLAMSDEQSWDRKLDTVRKLSASWKDYLHTNWRGPLVNSLGNNSRFPLSPGLACMILAAMGTVAGLRNGGTRRLTVFLVVFLAAGYLLSLGPRLIVWGQLPFLHLAAWLPGLNALRSPYRFAVLVQIGCVVLAGLTFLQPKPNPDTGNSVGQGDLAAAPHKRSPPVTKRVRAIRCVHMGILIAVLVECWPATPALYSMPDYGEQRPWIEWLAIETEEDDIVAILPFPTGRTVSDYEESTVDMLWATHYKRRLANGYTGFFPKPFVQLKRDVQSFPDTKSLLKLQKATVQWCVVDVARMDRSNIDKLADQSLLSLRFETKGGCIRIYEVARRPN